MVSSATYLCCTEDPHLSAVARHLIWVAGRGGYAVLKCASAVLNRYHLQYVVDEEGITDPNRDRVAPKRLLCFLREAQKEQLEGTLSAKVIHSVFSNQCRQDGWDFAGSHAWLTDGRLRAQNEALIVAAQDGVIHTRAYRARVLKETVSPTYRVCRQAPETIGHLLSGCEPMMWTLYKERHDRVLYKLVLALARTAGLTVPERLRWGPQGWDGVAVMQDSELKITVDVSIPTDRAATGQLPLEL